MRSRLMTGPREPTARQVLVSACRVADAWEERIEPMLWARIAAEAPELAQALDEIEVTTRFSRLRKDPP